MRIGLNSSDLQGVAGETAATPTGASKARLASSEDDGSFPEDTVTIGGLASRALQTPEIRHDEVGSLQQRVLDGQYELDPSAIAEAMLYQQIEYA